MKLSAVGTCPQQNLRTSVQGQWYKAYKEENLIGYVFVEAKVRTGFDRKQSVLSRTKVYFEISGNGEFAETPTAYPLSDLIRELVIALIGIAR